MSSIDSTSQFLSKMAAQVTALARQAPLKSGSDASQARARPPATGTTAGADRQALIVQRVRAIADDDPQRRRKAFRIFLESVLSSELGGDLINDPAFHRLIDQVQQSMEANQELLPAIDRAGGFLLDSARRRK